MPCQIDRAKQTVRERVWDALDAARAVYTTPRTAASRTSAGQKRPQTNSPLSRPGGNARIVKAVPDKAQKHGT